MQQFVICSTLGNDLISFHSYLFWCLPQKSEVPADYDKHDPEQKQIYRFVRTLFSAAQLTAECAIVTLVSKQFSRETQSLHTFSPFLFALTQISATERPVTSFGCDTNATIKEDVGAMLHLLLGQPRGPWCCFCAVISLVARFQEWRF